MFLRRAKQFLQGVEEVFVFCKFLSLLCDLGSFYSHEVVLWNYVALEAIAVTKQLKYAMRASSLRQAPLSIDFNRSCFLNALTEKVENHF